jgi:protein O-GlcNAc transferase
MLGFDMTPLTISESFRQAFHLQHSGRLTEAEPIYRRILAEQPNHADALHMFGVLSHQLGSNKQAIELIQRAIAVKGSAPEYHCNLGVVLAEEHRFAEAAAAYHAALVLAPEYAEAHNNLANVLIHLGQFSEAIAASREALRIRPQWATAYFNLGNALIQLGESREAAAAYRQALASKSDHAEAHSNLANALSQLGYFAQAAEACREALRLKPDYADAHNNLSSALVGLGRLEEAVAASRMALKLNPQCAEAQINLGNAFKDMGKFQEAINAYREAQVLKPSANIHNNLGVAFLQAGRLDEALNSMQQALDLQPELAEAHSNLGSALKEIGQIDEAVQAYCKALAFQPNLLQARNNLLLAVHYHPEYDAFAILREARRWSAIHAEPLAASIRAHANDPDPNRRLRIGYVSPDFRDHVEGHVLLSLIREHDRRHFEIVCYSNVRCPDAITEQFQSHADCWRSIYGVTDEQVCEEIRADRIDILVDLALHTGGNRLPLFARKPAPVQIAYLAYCGTSGMATMDYRLSDPHMDPLDMDLACYSEQTIHLPQTYWCYQPGGPTPPVSDLPAKSAGWTTFGCMNNLAKVSDPALDLWSEILTRTTRARLLIHAPDCSRRQSLIDRLAGRSITPDRVEFISREPWDQYLRVFHRIDVALDPFPFGGGITTCDTLWMGVPVVTLAGHTAVGRGGKSILNNIGLPELVADTPQQYAQIAVDLAENVPRLEELRRTLREKMLGSPLMDLPRFARDIEAAYRGAWRNWCSKK